MPHSSTCFAVTLALTLMGAPAARADRPAEPADYARPVNRCQIGGQHVSGVVSVGGPAAYLARAYRSADGGVQLAPSVPFEITLAPDPSMASVRLPAPFGDGALFITVPCVGLRAGAPRANTRPRPVEARPRLLTLLHGTRVLSAAGAGAELARVERTDGAQQPLSFVGRVGPARDGFVRVSLRVGPARVDGFVPEGSVRSLGVGIGPTQADGGYAPQLESLSGMARVRLAAGTPIFGSPAAARGWASLTAPLTVYLRSRRPGERTAIALGAELIGTHACRYDGVAGRVSCGDARAVPRLGLRSCSGPTCVDYAFVNPP